MYVDIAIEQKFNNRSVALVNCAYEQRVLAEQKSIVCQVIYVVLGQQVKEPFGLVTAQCLVQRCCKILTSREQ